MQCNLSRRRFLGGCATALALPAFVPGSALGADGTVAPSERIAMGLIGCGGHGTGWNLDQVFRNQDSQVIAVCDVDRARCEAAQRKVNEHYSQALGKSYRGCATHDDFRDLLARKDIDAVANCTPDHWHVIPAVMAARCGKDVICEKPLTLTVAEGRLLCDTIAQTGRIFQTASENRSIDIYLHMCELVRNGRIGKLTHINVYLPEGNEERGQNFSERESQPVPEGFNYDMWLGQAPVAPYCPARCHGSFRWNYDYAGGRLTDWGAHLIDLAQWGNDTESTGPVEVHGTCTFPPAGSLFNTPETFSVDYVYANGVTMNVSSGVPGIRFEGTDGWISSIKWRGPLAASRPEILHSQIRPDEVQLYHPSQIVKRAEVSMGGEHRNLIDCVKSREPCYAPAEIGHRTASIAHIGNIALRLGRKLRWNPEAERFVDDPEADKMLSRPQREPWTLANVAKWIEERA